MKHSSIVGIVCAGILVVGSTSANAVAVSGQGTWETTLQARTFDGNTIGGYYDTALNITWLANANYAGTTMYWDSAMSWISSLNINGITGWRLPTTGPVNGSGFNDNFATNGSTDYGFNMSAPGTIYAGSTGSEMAHLNYVTLGNKALVDVSGGLQSGWGLTNSGPFSNIQTLTYWSATEYAPATGSAWTFLFTSGEQDITYKWNGLSVWAVHSGDVGTAIAPVPAPAAVWLFGSGLIGFLGFGRKRRL